jgi:hypothetical protein
MNPQLNPQLDHPQMDHQLNPQLNHPQMNHQLNPQLNSHLNPLTTDDHSPLPLDKKTTPTIR